MFWFGAEVVSRPFLKKNIMTQIQLDFGNEKFWKFHKENPQVYDLFKSVVFRAIERGYKRFSADMAWNIMRWETSVKTNDKDFKLNDHHRSFYARLFVVDFPQYIYLFSFRQSKANALLNKFSDL